MIFRETPFPYFANFLSQKEIAMFSRRYLYLLIAACLGLLFVVGLINLPAFAQSPVPTTSSPSGILPGTVSIVPYPPAPPSAILYSQYDNPSANSYSTQNFEPVLDAYDDFLADDFTVPTGQKWNLDRVDVQGTYFNGTGPADSMNVFIYTEAITMPGTLVYSRTAMSFANVDTNFSIVVSPAIVLEPGKYWVSVQANQNFDPAGQWGWTGRTVTSNFPAMWQNPGGGFGSLCTSWGLRSVCVSGPEAPDQVFRLLGKVTFTQCGIALGWAVSTNLPEAAYGANVTTNGTYAYVVGGYDFPGVGNITTTLRYDPVFNSFTSLEPVPHPVAMASLIYSPINNKLYLFGGENIGTSEVYSSTLIYNIASDTWVSGASMPEPRDFMAGGYYNGKIYLVGGYSTASVDPAFSQVWEYNVAANTWATKTSMPEALGGAASAVVNGHLYVIGGRDPVNDARSQTYDYDIALDSWTVRANTPYPVNVPGTAVVDGKIWVIGGGNPFLGLAGLEPEAAVRSPNAMSTTVIYNPSTNSWVNGPTLNIPRSFVAATTLRDRIIAIGGFDGTRSTGVTEIIKVCLSYLPQLRK